MIKNKEFEKKRQRLSILAKHYFNSADIKDKQLQIKEKFYQQLKLPNFNYYKIEGDLIFCDQCDDQNYNIQVFHYPFALKQVESVELEKDNNNKVIMIKIKIRNCDKQLNQLQPLQQGIDRLLDSSDPYARKVAYLVQQLDAKMKSTRKFASKVNKIQVEEMESNTAAQFLEAYHQKLHMKAQKITETHPFYIIRLAKSKQAGMIEDKLQLKLVEISPKLLEILKIDLETGIHQLINNQWPQFYGCKNYYEYLCQYFENLLKRTINFGYYFGQPVEIDNMVLALQDGSIIDCTLIYQDSYAISHEYFETNVMRWFKLNSTQANKVEKKTNVFPLRRNEQKFLQKYYRNQSIINPSLKKKKEYKVVKKQIKKDN